MSFAYFAVYVDDKHSFQQYEEIGYWCSYHIYRVESSVITRMTFGGKRVIFMPENVAMAWKFAGANRPFIRVSGSGSKQHEQLPSDMLIQYKPEKVDYFLTEEDTQNAIKFMKLIIRGLAHQYYEQIWESIKPQVSRLEELGSAAGVSVQLKKNPEYARLLESILGRLGATEARLSAAKTIADCNEVLKQLQIDVGM